MPAPQHAAGRLIAHVGHAVGGDPPELRVEHLQRDIPVVADPAQLVQDRLLGVETALETVLQERSKKTLGERRRGKDHKDRYSAFTPEDGWHRPRPNPS